MIKPPFVVCTAFVVLVSGVVPVTRATQATDAEVGKTLYVEKGCFECHGLLGQGSVMSGPALAPATPGVQGMETYVRNPSGQMPVYSVNILSHADLEKIYAYLVSLPKSRPVESIPLLKSPQPTTPSGAQAKAASLSNGSHGEAVYVTYCVSCHGARGEGGAGPVLLKIGENRSTSAIEAFIRSPAGIMPRLYPSTLDARDVSDVAKYVETFK